MLPEIGEAGQARILALEVTLRGDAGATRVARDYLERAGATVGRGDATDVAVVEPGRPELAAAAAHLAGAWTAVEAIKGAVGAGRASSGPSITLAGPPR